MNNITRASLTFILIVFATSILHWCLIQIYALWCAPAHMSGALKSLFTLGSPFCQFLNYIQYELSKHYITIWGSTAIALFAFIAGKLSV